MSTSEEAEETLQYTLVVLFSCYRY